MQRPDQIELFVPFVFLHMSWNPYSGDAAFTPKSDRKRHKLIDDFEPTTIANYFELWRDFDGRRLPVEFDRDWLDVVAVHDGKRITLAVTNMGGRQIAVDLSGVAKRDNASAATQIRLNYHKGKVVFESEHDVDAAAIPVDVNETTVVRLKLDQELVPTKKLAMQRHYATATAVKSQGEPFTFSVNVGDTNDIVSARVIIGVHRRGGVTAPLAVEMNGSSIEIDNGDAAEFSEFFAPLDAKVERSVLRDENRVKITAQPGTTITSVQLVTHRLQH
jgi:agarase